MLGCVDAGFEAIHATALKAAISGSILALPEACLVIHGMQQFLLFGATFPLQRLQKSNHRRIHLFDTFLLGPMTATRQHDLLAKLRDGIARFASVCSAPGNFTTRSRSPAT
jgi:hypothetical protein